MGSLSDPRWRVNLADVIPIPILSRVIRWYHSTPFICIGLLLLSAGSGMADGGAIPADSWPTSWFQAPRSASDAGIVEFHEAPLLAARVARGELPVLRQRLPDDPYIVEPAERVGRYGGKIRVFHRDAGLVSGLENPLGIDPTVHEVLPNLAS